MRKAHVVKAGMLGLVLLLEIEAASADVEYVYTYTTLDAPGTAGRGDSYTELVGIYNSGQIVGDVFGPSSSSGFLYSGGSFTTIADPDQVLYPSTVVYGINDSGQIVGASSSRSFIYSNGSFTTFEVPGSEFTTPFGINDNGQIVGTFLAAGIVSQEGFLYTDGSFTAFADPSAVGATYPQGINNRGQIVGYFEGPARPDGPIPNLNNNYGFVSADGNFTTIAAPDGGAFYPAGINDNGQIVGYYGGYLYSDGNFTPIQDPNGTLTFPMAVNDNGQIVGYFVGNDGYSHGFLATPTAVPEPRTLPIVSGSLMFLLGLGYRHKSTANRRILAATITQRF
ncbi:MAG: hypothetical protein JO323_25660 [Acidobacteriia bacterium]|nr:hypothetical protein [Terriglobia bacterium]